MTKEPGSGVRPGDEIERLLRPATRLIPAEIRNRLREIGRRWRFRSACRALLALSPGEELSPGLIERLSSSWGNTGWSAGAEFLFRMARLLPSGGGTILECGSGLSTIVLAALTRGTGHRVLSLEHLDSWAGRVRIELERMRLSHVKVLVAPLRDFGTYQWYDVEPTEIPAIALVVCDGPRGNTPGGRVGLLRRLHSRIKPGSAILLDDASRTGEQEVLEIWQREFGTRHVVQGDYRSVAIVTFPGCGASPPV